MARPFALRLDTTGGALALALGVLSTGPALAAAPVFSPPAGCTLEMTVQNRSCTVSQHYRCDADTPGDQWVEYFTREGASYRSRIDNETRWMESHGLVDGITDVIEEGGPDDSSLTTLLAEGSDDFDFWTRSDTGERLHHVGRDELTGETADIAGVPLKITRFQLKTYDEADNLLTERSGQQFVNESQRRFYGGVETATDWTGERQDTNDSPVQFSLPGQPGFGSTEPQYDCEMQMVGRATGGGA